MRDQFQIPAQAQNAAFARHRVKLTALEIGLVDKALEDLEVAVGEAVTNAILHGSPRKTSHIKIRCFHDQEENAFTVEVSDSGKGFDVEGPARSADMESPSGRGLRLMRALTDRLVLLRNGGGMTVSLTKYLHP